MIPTGSRQDQEAIRRYYMKNGYADFRIINTDVALPSDNPAGYVITITVEEGPQYHVSGVGGRFAHCQTCDGAPLVNHRGDCGQATSMTRRGREVGRGDHARRRPPGLRVLAGPAARRPRRGRRIRSRSASRSTMGRTSISNASTSWATPAPATTSSGASSISAKATPTTTC